MPKYSHEFDGFSFQRSTNAFVKYGTVAHGSSADLGSYFAYVPYGSIPFDRMMASTKMLGTAVFAIYVADAHGYTGSVAVLLFKDRVVGDTTRLDVFRSFSFLLSTLLLASVPIFCGVPGLGLGLGLGPSPDNQKSRPVTAQPTLEGTTPMPKCPRPHVRAHR